MSVPIPNFPTDNLYKFMALSGVFLLVFTNLFLEIYMHNTRKISLAVSTEVEHDYVYLNASTPDENSKVRFNQEELNKFIESSKTQKLKLAEVQSRTEALDKMLIPTFIVQLIGLLMTVLGFLLWYKRVQRPIDRILLLNLKKAECEVENLSSGSPIL